MYIQADCSKREGCEGLVEEVLKRCGRLDLLVCTLAALAVEVERGQLSHFGFAAARQCRPGEGHTARESGANR